MGISDTMAKNLKEGIMCCDPFFGNYTGSRLQQVQLQRAPGVTEYFDPPLKILAPALISQKKYAPSQKRHLIFCLNINSTTKFLCFLI